MDKNNEQKNNKTPETKPKQDSFRPWLKLIPAAAVFAAAHKKHLAGYYQ